MSKSATNTSGIGFCGMLTVLFVGLKLTDYIDWSWWLVLSPLWVPAAIVITLILIAAALAK